MRVLLVGLAIVACAAAATPSPEAIPTPSPTPSPSTGPGSLWAIEQQEITAIDVARRPGIPDVVVGCNSTERDRCGPRLSLCLLLDPRASTVKSAQAGAPTSMPLADGSSLAVPTSVCDCYLRHGKCLQAAGCPDIAWQTVQYCTQVLVCPLDYCEGTAGAVAAGLATGVLLLTSLAAAAVHWN